MDASSIKFCNEKIRPSADALVQLFYASSEILDLWNAMGGVLAIPNDGTVIVDGSPGDGRRAITGAMVNNIIARLFEYHNDQSASGNAKLNTEIAVAVNTVPRF